MHWVVLVFLTVTLTPVSYTKNVESNELLIPPPPVKLDTNLRKALLKALTELENEENEKAANEERVVEKAFASSISFYANSDPVTNDTAPTTTSSKPTVLFQKSEESTEKIFTSFEKESLDPVNESEQFLTSASSSFTSDSNKNEVRSLESSSKKSSIKIETTTAVTTTSSTEESEAKVEHVQFFSAPLVAAFTVHQDEQGMPKKVEPIFKSSLEKEEFRKKLEEKKNIFLQEQVQLKQQFQQEQEQVKQRHQLDLIEKQKRLEEEILRLKQQQKDQEAFFKQQLLHQEQIRLQNTDQSFRSNSQFNQFSASKPILNEPTKTILNQFVTERNTLKTQNSFVNFVTPTPTQSQPGTQEANSGISFQPSIAFDPLVEAGKLPVNGQILPVKNAVDFRSPFIQTPHFQQFHSISNTFSPPFVNNFPQQNRFLRQEQNVGNFGTNNGFFSQQSLPPLPLENEKNFFKSGTNLNNFQFQDSSSNKVFRNNLDLPPSIQKNFQNVQQQQQQQQTRFFRSNLEGSFSSPNSFQTFTPPAPNNQLNSLLYNSGAFRGKPQEDLNIISKVLSLNHLGSDSRFSYRNVPFIRK